MSDARVCPDGQIDQRPIFEERLALVRVSRDMMAHLLDLPSGIRVLRAIDDPERAGVTLLVGGEDLPAGCWVAADERIKDIVPVYTQSAAGEAPRFSGWQGPYPEG